MHDANPASLSPGTQTCYEDNHGPRRIDRSVAMQKVHVFNKAAFENDLQLLSQISKKDVNLADELGITPLHISASLGNLDGIRILLSKGANPDQIDFEGNAAVHYAAAGGHQTCLVLLTNYGANIWVLNDRQKTAADEAALHGKIDCMQHLDALVSHQVSQDRRRVIKLQMKSKRIFDKRIARKEKSMQRSLSRSGGAGGPWRPPTSNRPLTLPISANGQSDSLSILGTDSPRFSQVSSETKDGGSTNSSIKSLDVVYPSRSFYGASGGLLVNEDVYRPTYGQQTTHRAAGNSSGQLLFAKNEYRPRSESNPLLPGLERNPTRLQGLLQTRTEPVNDFSKVRSSNGSNMDSVLVFLKCIDLEQYHPMLAREGIDMKCLMMCTDDDLREIGIPMGPRKILDEALSKRRSLFVNKDNNLQDTLI